MTNDQLMGKYTRLRQELTQAYAEPVPSAARDGLIDRLASELLDLERRIALLQAPPAAPIVAAPDVPPDRLAA
jgi:hypothetical protein